MCIYIIFSNYHLIYRLTPACSVSL